MPKLVFTNGALSGKSYELILEKTTVGRTDHNTLAIHDPSLSSTHCEILMHGDEIIVHDLDSRNGTVVNGTLLHNTQAPLKHGQVIQFGSVEARLELDGESEDSTASDITAVHAFGRAIRDQRRAERNPKPTDPLKHLGPPESEDTEKTIVVPQSTLKPQPAPQASVAPSAEPRASKSWLWLVIVAAVAAAALLWRFLGR